MDGRDVPPRLHRDKGSDDGLHSGHSVTAFKATHPFRPFFSPTVHDHSHRPFRAVVPPKIVCECQSRRRRGLDRNACMVQDSTMQCMCAEVKDR
jgi:hypothetical protein